jgi:hypothetical protein
MLKVVYTAESITVVCLAGRLERLVAQRSVLAVRLGQSLHIQRGIATLLLPLDLAGSVPAILVKKQGDFPAFWKKEIPLLE